MPLEAVAALSIAGSDSGGGAGIQGDLLSFAGLGVVGTTAITALTAQNTQGVHAVFPVDADAVVAQINAVLDDFPVRAVKTGMLHDQGVVRAVARSLRGRGLPLVVDPVVLSSSGRSLLSPAGVETLIEDLLPLADLVTPNRDELARMDGRRSLGGLDDRVRAAKALLDRGAGGVLVTGGDEGAEPEDVLVLPEGAPIRFRGARIPGAATHGTGCALSAAVAAYMAKGQGVIRAVELARRFVREAMLGARPQVGAGAGPLHHLAALRPRIVLTPP